MDSIERRLFILRSFVYPYIMSADRFGGFYFHYRPKCAAEVNIVPTAQAGAAQHRVESAEPVQELLLQSDSVCTDGASATIERRPVANTVSR
ncbi:unnamed protein product [Angiostrongylus costaricensis]|uniref:Uncharacterized protein n=1 Tax=Angiostrongylus costaricensis TaxID=334426 RepID=A0A0R3PGE3_ANGCS|nr:unnamed protein product [Angiostrongylus costaricensis]